MTENNYTIIRFAAC